MRIITEPKVYLVTRPNIDMFMVNTFMDDEGLPIADEGSLISKEASEAIVEISARLCYMSFAKGRKDIEDFINNLLSSGDGSVLEHVNYGFVFTGISRSLSHELVRHRAGFAYSQRSQRYVDESDPGFIMPPSVLAMGDGSPIYATMVLGFEQALKSYNQLVAFMGAQVPKTEKGAATEQRKKIRQAARAVLPNATETKMMVTGNVRAWRHFIEQRASQFADLEIRRLAIAVLEVLQEEASLLFQDFTISDFPDGTRIAIPKYNKV